MIRIVDVVVAVVIVINADIVFPGWGRDVGRGWHDENNIMLDSLYYLFEFEEKRIIIELYFLFFCSTRAQTPDRVRKQKIT